MKAYHFVKYGENSSPGRLIAQCHSDTTVCFDFEDSIQDSFDPAKNSALKKKYRTYFRSIIDRHSSDFEKINFGVRINAIGSHEYEADLALLNGIKKISSLFVPKISGPGQLAQLQNDLKKTGLIYDEIIPVIESKAGLENLTGILKTDQYKIKGIAFGHCDYNADCANYPFFHQDSREYWTWVNCILQFTKAKKLRFLNSPFLQLGNDAFFREMLAVLYSLAGEKAAQITLTQKQTWLCNSFEGRNANTALPEIANRLDMRIPESYAENFIRSFEKNAGEKGFSVTKERRLLSPQEYSASLDQRRRNHWPEINFTFVGGCFPVQGNLPFDKLFHQLIKTKIESSRNVKFNIRIIRYERFSNCTAKIETANREQPTDILVFSVRPEPFLRLVKLYYRFYDRNSRREKRSVNLPVFGKNNPEKHDLLSLETAFNPGEIQDGSAMKKTLINLNYFSGMLLGNVNYALRKYLALVNEVIQMGKRNKTRVFILGPPVRTNTFAERILSQKLGSFMQKNLDIPEDDFIPGSALYEDGEVLFKNGIYAKEKYHELIAERLFTKLLPVIDEIEIPLVSETAHVFI